MSSVSILYKRPDTHRTRFDGAIFRFSPSSGFGFQIGRSAITFFELFALHIFNLKNSFINRRLDQLYILSKLEQSSRVAESRPRVEQSRPLYWHSASGTIITDQYSVHRL